MYANDFLNRYGKKKWFVKQYSGMGALRIAQELWFHALAYYVGKPLQTILSWLGVSWNWLNEIINSAQKMEINSTDNRAWIFALVWFAGLAIKRYLSLYFQFPLNILVMMVL